MAVNPPVAPTPAPTSNPVPAPDVPEPTPVAEAGVTTSEWRLIVGYLLQLAGAVTLDAVNGVSQLLFHASVTIPPDQLQLIEGLEVTAAIGVVGYAVSRGVRKLGTTG